MNLKKGKIYGFIGHNGCGKSVFFKILCGFLSPDQGDIHILGKKLGSETDFPKDTGVIIESPGFLEYTSGFKNLKILSSIRKKISSEKIRYTMERVDLDPANKTPVKKYSLGMKQRLAIAQAIMEKPKLLILDEPFNGLDKDGVAKMRSLLLHEREEGTTILLTSHIHEDIQLLCDDIFEFTNKNLIQVSNKM
ncbi:ATP-binding cassette domain-containing protein [Marinicrinis sediminis]|uniref:ATP-binding cassette domain-containing protein n=1 Tax=Marinicrinis sediminis TaxID=1652465 RepID=A0ABW5R9T7_9BACL